MASIFSLASCGGKVQDFSENEALFGQQLLLLGRMVFNFLVQLTSKISVNLNLARNYELYIKDRGQL